MTHGAEPQHCTRKAPSCPVSLSSDPINSEPMQYLAHYSSQLQIEREAKNVCATGLIAALHLLGPIVANDLSFSIIDQNQLQYTVRY